MSDDVAALMARIQRPASLRIARALLASPAHQALIAAAEQRGRVAALREAAWDWTEAQSEDDTRLAHSPLSRRWVTAPDWLRERADREEAQP